MDIPRALKNIQFFSIPLPMRQNKRFAKFIQLDLANFIFLEGWFPIGLDWLPKRLQMG